MKQIMGSEITFMKQAMVSIGVKEEELKAE